MMQENHVLDTAEKITFLNVRSLNIKKRTLWILLPFKERINIQETWSFCQSIWPFSIQKPSSRGERLFSSQSFQTFKYQNLLKQTGFIFFKLTCAKQSFVLMMSLDATVGFEEFKQLVNSKGSFNNFRQHTVWIRN